MKWTIEKPTSPKKGDLRTRKAFLWLPKEISGQVRWLERAEWEERLLCSADNYCVDYWHAVRWTDLEPKPEAGTDYGHGFKAVQLVNGMWVLTHGEFVCDLKSPGYKWKPGDRFYTSCMATRQKIDEMAAECMAAMGVFRE